MAAPKKTKTKPQPPTTVQNFPIVGIGASAGGLDAFKRLIAAVPESSGMAYVLVQHLDPSHESILPDILQRVTTIPVLEITDDIPLAPDHIYVIPANKMLISTDGVLKLTDREKKINLSIDFFFESLADVHKELAVGVVLSGTGSDGTLGLKAIKEHGGICIAQDSESAAYDSMPQSAVNAGVVDFVLAPENIPLQLLQINRAYKTSHVFKEEEELPKDDEATLKQILLLLRQRSGVDFTYYKQPTFHRRIARRMAIVKRENLGDYLKFLRTDKAEQDALFQDVLIPVTSFFRDPKTFLALTQTIFPAIIKNKSSDGSIRVWIAGCSTGEEAFSIAICLHEFLGEKMSNMKIQIFATDISERAIKKARAAIYTKVDVEKLSATQLKSYFVKNNGGYEVGKLIRGMCVFAPHNFLKDPPFAKMDLITCRNVLIYMDAFLQKKAFTTFHYALKENGFLLLGKSETTGTSSDLFTQAEKYEKIYSRKPVLGRFMPVTSDRKEEFFVTKDRMATKPDGTQTDFRKSAEEIMILKSPASVVVNKAMDIVHIYGDVTPFLQAPSGKPTYNLLKMAREGLAFELRNAIHKATKEQVTVTKENIPVKVNEKQSLATIEIIPLTDTVEPYYLIRFEEKIIPVVKEEKQSSPGKTIETQKQNKQLEKELSQTREDMRSITEDMEAANEELQSANEELQSSNEEMQSLNEELETSKEELQSTNEELIIVNQELLDKQEQLNAAYAAQVEARKRIEASEKEQEKLASQLKLATDSAKAGIGSLNVKTEKLEWSGLMKKMWGYSEHLDNLTLEDWVKSILPEDKAFAFQKIEESKNNRSIYDAEYRIKRANDGTIAWMKSIGQHQYDEFGEAITLTGISLDITEQKEASEKLKATVIELATKNKQIEESETFNRTILESSPDCLKVLDGEGRIQYMNFSGICQMEIDDFSTIKNKYWWTLWGKENEGMVKAAVDKAVKGETAHFTALCPTAKGTDKWWNVVISPVVKSGEPVQQIISVSRDITQQKEAEEQIRQSEEMFKSIFDNSLAVIVVTNDQGNYLSANKAASELFGYTVNELLQMNVGDLKTTAKAGATKRFEEYMRKGEEAGEFDFITKNGTHKFVQYQAIRIKADFHLSIMMDITEQKLAEGKILQSEEQLRKSKEHLQAGIQVASVALAEIDYHTGLVRLSTEAALIYGLSPDRLLVTRQELHNTFHPGDKEQLLELIAQSSKPEGNGLIETEHRVLLPSGEVRWLKVNKEAFFDKQHAKPLYGILAAQDITAKKQTEEKLHFLNISLEKIVVSRTTELSNRNIQLEDANVELASFNYIASHDLQEPLRKIQGFSKRILDTDRDKLSDTTKDYFSRINSAAQRMQKLIESLISLSHASSSQVVFEKTDLNQTLTEVQTVLNELIIQKNAVIESDNLPTLPAVPIQMQQLFLNLIGNALKYTKPNVIPLIKITAEKASTNEIRGLTKPDSKFWKMTISDNGIGFEQKYENKIFEVFQRLHGKAAYEGTGIGLAICKKIVQAHGGTISAIGEPNVGTTFTFYLSDTNKS